MPRQYRVYIPPELQGVIRFEYEHQPDTRSMVRFKNAYLSFLRLFCDDVTKALGDPEHIPTVTPPAVPGVITFSPLTFRFSVDYNSQCVWVLDASIDPT